MVASAMFALPRNSRRALLLAPIFRLRMQFLTAGAGSGPEQLDQDLILVSVAEPMKFFGCFQGLTALSDSTCCDTRF